LPHWSSARILMFPLLSSLLAVGSLIVVFFTGYFASSVSSALVREVLYLQLLGTGLLVVLPLLGEEMPPRCTHPVRTLFAFVDGPLDAIPGILVRHHRYSWRRRSPVSPAGRGGQRRH
jgi:cytochrome c oxidase assembly factor CtaG